MPSLHPQYQERALQLQQQQQVLQLMQQHAQQQQEIDRNYVSGYTSTDPDIRLMHQAYRESCLRYNLVYSVIGDFAECAISENSVSQRSALQAQGRDHLQFIQQQRQASCARGGINELCPMTTARCVRDGFQWNGRGCFSREVQTTRKLQTDTTEGTGAL